MEWLTNLTQDPTLVQWVRPVVLAAALAYAMLTLAGWLMQRTGRARNRLSEFAGLDGRQTVEVGSQAYRIRLAFQAWRLDVAGRETEAVWLARLGGGALAALALLAAGLQPLMALAGFGLAWLLLENLITASWRKLTREIEADVPTMLMRLSSVVQVTPNVLVAVGEVAETFSAGRPLRAWLQRFGNRLAHDGLAAMPELLAEAQVISPGLGVAVYEIGRLGETGGAGYQAAFTQTGKNLTEILSGRADAAARGESAKGSVLVIILMMVLEMVFMLRTPQFAAVMSAWWMQLAYVGLVLWMVVGWMLTENMIDEAVQ